MPRKRNQPHFFFIFQGEILEVTGLSNFSNITKQLSDLRRIPSWQCLALTTPCSLKTLAYHTAFLYGTMERIEACIAKLVEVISEVLLYVEYNTEIEDAPIKKWCCVTLQA